MNLQRAFDWAGDCDLLLAVGSTLVVEPAAGLPRVAKQNGALLGIITLSETPLDAVADIKIFDSCGKALSAVMAHLSEKKQ
jgi:NAD-dependent deacetylase